MSLIQLKVSFTTNICLAQECDPFIRKLIDKFAYNFYFVTNHFPIVHSNGSKCSNPFVFRLVRRHEQHYNL